MITQGLEDYLEIIYNKICDGEKVKAVDIAREFNISRSSVSEALIRLADKNLIIYEGRKGISVTSEGESEAKKIIKRHKILSDFFNKVLGLDDYTASKNACKIEHVIDDKIIDKMKTFTDFCVQTNINNKFKEIFKENDR